MITEPLLPSLPDILIDTMVRAALLEDFGRFGDITSQATLNPDMVAKAVMNTREDGILAGMDFAAAAFRLAGTGVLFKPLAKDGEAISRGQNIALVEGPARAVLSGERVALNFLMHLSGVASYTARFAAALSGTHAKVTCTRKTLPGLRSAEKYAVRCGGGSSHRLGLYDAILIKDNHIAVSGSVGAAIRKARAFAGHLVKVEVEVDSLEQLREAIDAQPDVILLDNMDPETLSEAVDINRRLSGLSSDAYVGSHARIKLEASGNVNLETISSIGATGVDYVSTSKITMAAPPMDIGLDIGISDARHS
jgi:nicotinate-nucleotide pyrophosphorylase (carboxylating)